MSDRLDTLLSQPLAEMPDNGFSSRVMAQMELQRLRRDRLKTEISAGFVVLAVLILPFTVPGRILAASAASAGGMTLIGLTVGVLLTFFALKPLRDVKPH